MSSITEFINSKKIPGFVFRRKREEVTVVAAWTGQRPGDVLKLQIRDIDFHRKITYFRVNKTSGEFKFPVYGKLEGFLRDEMGFSESSDRDLYLFPGLTIKAVGIAFRKIKKEFGFNRRQYYTLKTSERILLQI